MKFCLVVLLFCTIFDARSIVYEDQCLCKERTKKQWQVYKKYVFPVELSVARAANLLETYSATPIVVLYGSSCAGKTTISNTLGNNFVCASVDKILVDFYITELQKLYPQSIQAFLTASKNNPDNLLFCVFEQICPSSTIKTLWDAESTSVRFSLLQMIEKQLYLSPIFSLFAESFRQSLRGKVVVLDLVGDSVIWFFQAMALNRFHCPLIRSFVFCHPKILSKRILDRNKRAVHTKNVGDIRFNSLPITQLVTDCVRTRFRTRPFFSAELRSSVLEILDTAMREEREIISLIHPQERLNKDGWLQRKEAVVRSLLNTKPEHYVDCDVILDTSQCKFTAERLIEILKLCAYERM